MRKDSMRPFKLVLFDLDGTLTQEKSAWEYIHRRLGVWDGYAEKFQESFLRGEISYDHFCQLDAEIWKGMNVRQIDKILQEIPLYDGVGDFVQYLRSKGMKLGIISSGLSLLSDWVKEQYGFDYAVANELEITDGVVTGNIRIHVHYDQKADWVQDACRKFNASQREIIAIGDSSGDISMLQMSGFSIAFNSLSVALNRLANVCITSNDLRDLIPPLMPHLGSPD